MVNKNIDVKWITASPVQLRMYIASMLNSCSTAYNVITLFTLRGKIEEKRLLEAILNTVDSNCILKARFRYMDDTLQYCVDEEQLQIEKKYLNDIASDEELKEAALKDFVTPFDVLGGPLCRIRVVFANNDATAIVLDCHHMIFDTESVSVFAGDLQDYYEGKIVEKNEEYDSFAKWQREYVQGSEYQEKLKYWETLFSEPAQLCDFWKKRATEENIRITDSKKIDISRQQITEFCKKNEISEHDFLIAALNLVYGRLTDQKDITLGSFSSERKKESENSIVGMFVNTFPIRNAIDDDMSVTDYFNKVKESVYQSKENASVQYDDICRVAHADRKNPMFQVAVRIRDSFENLLNINGLDCSVEEIEPKDNDFEFLVKIERKESTYECIINYARECYSRDIVEIFLKYLNACIDYLLSGKYLLLGDIPYINEEDQKEILEKFNATQTEYPREKTVVDLFEEQAEKNPDTIAVV